MSTAWLGVAGSSGATARSRRKLTVVFIFDLVPFVEEGKGSGESKMEQGGVVGVSRKGEERGMAHTRGMYMGRRTRCCRCPSGRKGEEGAHFAIERERKEGKERMEEAGPKGVKRGWAAGGGLVRQGEEGRELGHRPIGSEIG
jgi:hypothetical protein